MQIAIGNQIVVTTAIILKYVASNSNCVIQVRDETGNTIGTIGRNLSLLIEVQGTYTTAEVPTSEGCVCTGGELYQFEVAPLPATSICVGGEPPVTSDDSAGIGEVLAIPLMNDVPGDSPLDVTSVLITGVLGAGGETGTVAPNGKSATLGDETYTVNADGTITLSGNNGYIGTLTYTVESQSGLISNESTVTIERDGPDLTPIIQAIPNEMHGVTPFDIIVDINEILNVDTTGTITARVAKAAVNWTLAEPYDPVATNIGGVPVDNSNWTFSEDATNFIFTTTNSLLAGNTSTFGFKGLWDAGQSQGVTSISVNVSNAGDINNSNDNDSARIDFFIT